MENPPFSVEKPCKICGKTCGKLDKICGKLFSTFDLWKTKGVFPQVFPQAEGTSKPYQISVLKLFPQFPQALLLLYLKFKKGIEVE